MNPEEALRLARRFGDVELAGINAADAVTLSGDGQALAGLPPRASYWKAAHAKTHTQRKHELCTQIIVRRSESPLPLVCLHTVTTVRCL